jgi:hypothetical protein
MSARKAKRRPTARTRREPSLTYEQFVAAQRKMLDDGQIKPVAAGYFTDEDGVPIAGTARPKPCPWCGASGDDVTVVVRDIADDKEPDRRAHVQCEHCGGESPGVYESNEPEKLRTSKYWLMIQAAKAWNERAKVPS